MSNLLSGKRITAHDPNFIPNALREVLKTHNIEKDLPDIGSIPPLLYLKYRRHLAETFGDFTNYIPRTLPHLEDLAETMPGMWRFFIIAPDSPRNSPTLISNVVFFYPAEPDDTDVHGMAIGPRGVRYLVTGWAAGHHNMYLSWQDPKSPYSSLMIGSYPEYGSDQLPKLAGMTLHLRPPETTGRRGPLPTHAVMFFATKCDWEDRYRGTTFDGPLTEEQAIEKEDIDLLVRTALGGQRHLTPDQEEMIGKAFRRLDMSVSELEKKFEPVVTYLRSYDCAGFGVGVPDFSWSVASA